MLAQNLDQLFLGIRKETRANEGSSALNMICLGPLWRLFAYSGCPGQAPSFRGLRFAPRDFECQLGQSVTTARQRCLLAAATGQVVCLTVAT